MPGEPTPGSFFFFECPGWQEGRSAFLGYAGEVQVTELSSRGHQFNDFLDDEDVTVDGDGFACFGFLSQVEDGARMAAICHHDAHFIDSHVSTLG